MYLKHQLASGLTAAVSAIYAAIHKKMFRFDATTLTIWKEQINDISKRC